MARKLLFLLAILPLLLGAGCLSNQVDTTTMSVSLTWEQGYGDCDLGILEPYPDTTIYYATDFEYPSYSPNGRFSADILDGGPEPETWTLNRYHKTGEYTPFVVNRLDQTYVIDITITINGVTGSISEQIAPKGILQFLNFVITRNPSGDNQLQYTLIRKKINELPPNGPS